MAKRGLIAFAGLIVFVVALVAVWKWPEIRAAADDLASCAEALIAAPMPPTPSIVSGVDRFEDGIDHFMGPIAAIRVKDVPDETWITMSVVVDPSGRVISATPGKPGTCTSRMVNGHWTSVELTGAEPFFKEAADRAMKWRFVPFRRAGVPVYARVDFLDVRIYSPERRPEKRVPFPAVKDWNSIVIALTRTTCFGECKSYLVMIHGDGAVEYEGTAFVAIMGKHKARISRQAVRDIVELFRRADYFWLDTHYSHFATDNPAYATAISFDGHAMVVHDYIGLEDGMPSAVKDVEDGIDRIANTWRWLIGNSDTAASLVAEGWDFNAQSCEAQSLLSGVAHLGTAQAVHELLRAGAPVDGQCLSPPEYNYGRFPVGPAIIYAAERGDNEMTADLISAGAAMDDSAMQTALAAAAHSGKAEVVGLVAAAMKGKPDALTLHASLVNAAMSCSPAVTQKLLRLGAQAQGDRTIVLAALGNSGITDGENCARTITVLTRAGALVDARDDYPGDTALIKNCCSAAITTALIAAGADVNARNKTGRTALMHAWHKEVALALLKAGADPYLRDNEGKTALDILTDGDFGDAVPVLRDWMAKHPKKRG